MDTAFLKKHEDKRIRKGHLWIFSNEIFRIEGLPQNGSLIKIHDADNRFLGTGFYNKNSLIAIRFISNSEIEDLKDLFYKRILDAYNLRKKIYPSRESFRMVFAESDFLPGLIIDKYNDSFVLQINSFGMQNNIHLIIEILESHFKAKNIFSLNDFYLRKLEGLPEDNQVYLGQLGTEIIDDGSAMYKVDFSKSQKTGFYFDQSDNRFFIERLVFDKTVADVFCNSGGFGLHAIKANAKSVDFIDSSEREIENVKLNCSLNSIVGKTNFYVDDAFDFMEKSYVAQKKYDVVMIDPPAFAKNKKSLITAKKGYEKLNRLALSIINEGGFLVSSSCSHHIKKEDFLETISQAAMKTGKSLQLIHFSGASLDHPKLLAMDETEYLKFTVFKVNNC
ncbi:MAG: class I SAM-dependent rRNA methyltransferase [Ignavibacteriaceae bacterium]|nr:class I SAM-dependent rRNA methyltransferase [Ignavibacteriaceae bacterium]